MMEFENIQIQLLDTPPLVPQSIEWWLPPMLRRADALLLMVDLSVAPLTQMEAVMEQLEKMRIDIGVRKIEEEVLSRQKALIIGNKLDLAGARENYTALQNKYGEQLPILAISAKGRIGLEELKRKVYQVLDIIRVYTKVPGQKPDFGDPIILERRGSTLADAAEAVHKDFRAKLKYARVWGSGKHDGIMVKRNHILQDGDVIELHL